MGLQMRPSDPMAPHSVRYAPARDITWLYPNVLQKAENMLYDGAYTPLHEWLDREGVTEDDLARHRAGILPRVERSPPGP